MKLPCYSEDRLRQITDRLPKRLPTPRTPDLRTRIEGPAHKVSCQSIYLGLVLYAAAVFGFTRTRAQLHAGAMHHPGRRPEKDTVHRMYTSPIVVVATGVGPAGLLKVQTIF